MVRHDAFTSENEIASYIDKVKQQKGGEQILVGLLARNHPLYQERGSNQVNRIRGYVMAAFASTGLPDEAVVYACEELDNGHSPYLIATSARALRYAQTRQPFYHTFLVKALIRIGHSDEIVSLDDYFPQWPIQTPTTATGQILYTLQWLGQYAHDALPALQLYKDGNYFAIDRPARQLAYETIRAITGDTSKIEKDCCHFNFQQASFRRTQPSLASDIILQDHERRFLNLKDFLQGNFTLVAFFYTRCSNPVKCSLTITKLAQVQHQLAKLQHGRIQVAAISYDSAYDTPERIKDYGLNRNFFFNDLNRLFRTTEEGMEQLKALLNLQVSFMASIVNQHSIELFLVDERARVVGGYTGLEFDVAAVVADAEAAVTKNHGILRKAATVFSNSVLPFLLLFFPKCPVCWAGYLSLFGLTGVFWLKYNSMWFWVLGLLALVNVYVMYRQARQNHFFIPIYLVLIGYSWLIPAILLNSAASIRAIGVGLISLSSLATVFFQRRRPLHQFNQHTRRTKGILATYTGKIPVAKITRSL